MVQLNEQMVYTTAEAAKILKLSPITVERQIRRGGSRRSSSGKGIASWAETSWPSSIGGPTPSRPSRTWAESCGPVIRVPRPHSG